MRYALTVAVLEDTVLLHSGDPAIAGSYERVPGLERLGKPARSEAFLGGPRLGGGGVWGRWVMALFPSGRGSRLSAGSILARSTVTGRVKQKY